MASINVTKRGAKWQYRFEAASVDGKRKQISKSGFRTKKEALEAGTKALAEYNNAGLHFEPTLISVADYLDYWFEQYVSVNLKYNTQLGYLSVIENYLKPTFGVYKLSGLSPSVIQQFANNLMLRGLAKKSISGILSIFSKALDYAVEPLQYRKDNPMRYVQFPKVERKKKERIILTTEEFQQIIDRFPAGNRFHIPLLIGWNCGLRISETFGLTWDDIDFDAKTLSVNKQIVKRNYGVSVTKVLETKGKKEEKSSWYFQTTKTVSSVRTIKIGDTLLEALRAERTRQLKNELEYGEFYTIHVVKTEKDEKGNDIQRIIPVSKAIQSQFPRANLICIAENGEYTSTDSFKYPSRIIHKEMKLAFDYHSLRHTHATLLIENGASPKAVQNRLGHHRIETTLQTYVHTTEAMEQNAVEIFESKVNTVVHD